MPKIRTLVLPLALFASPFGCAAVSDTDPAANSEENAANPNEEDDPTKTEESKSGSGGSIVVVGMSSGGSSMGGAPSTGATTGSGGATGPVLLPSCFKDSECNDKNNCTDDTCNATGQCVFSDNGTCECTSLNAATNCDDENPCTDDTCADNKCAHSNNTATCDDDGNACTQNLCEAGSCSHPDGGLCTEATVILRSVRDGNAGQWITVNAAGLLVWNIATAGGLAALFERVDVSDTTFTLKDSISGLFVGLNADDNLVATAAEESAAVFGTTPCPLDESIAVGIQVTTDDDGGNFAAAEPGGEIKARSGGCTPASAAAWERFEILPAGG